MELIKDVQLQWEWRLKDRFKQQRKLFRKSTIILANSSVTCLSYSIKVVANKPDWYSSEKGEQDLIFSGLIWYDWSRKEKKLRVCFFFFFFFFYFFISCHVRRALRVSYDNRDHRDTGRSELLRRLGFRKETQMWVITGAWTRWNQAIRYFFNRVKDFSVYARVSPQIKWIV